MTPSLFTLAYPTRACRLLGGCLITDDHIDLDILLAWEDPASTCTLAHITIKDTWLIGRRLGYADNPAQVHVR